MKIKYLLAIIMPLCIVLSACSVIDPLTILKANSQVKEFLDQYPNADITMTKISAKSILEENKFAKEICGTELEEKAHYKINMNDPDSNLQIYSYIDIETSEIICLRKIGKKVKEETEEKTEETEKEKAEIGEKIEEEEKKEIEDDDEGCLRDVELSGEESDNKILLKWTSYECADFKGYKIVWSDEMESPKYPENGYIKYITDKDETSFKDSIESKINYYGITVLLKDGKIYSNSIKIEAEDYEEKEEDIITENGEIVSYEPKLEYEIEDGKVYLEWEEYPGDDLSYYKVVWSQTNDNLMYPEDSYIQVISSKDTTEFTVPDKKFKEGVNYYRISAIRNGFYPDKESSQRINSNVVKIEKSQS